MKTYFVCLAVGACVLMLAFGAHGEPDREAWFPYEVGVHGTPIDLSFLNKDSDGEYIPAGAHGFLEVDGDEFVFEDGTPARFWGVNLTAGAAISNEERAAQLAERLARLGVNAVRLHHLDSWHFPIIDYYHPDGTTQHLDRFSMERLDRTIYELKQRGIYVILDPWVQRTFRENDGVEQWDEFSRGNFTLHPYVYFDNRMQELIQKTWQQVWTHENEYTGLAYKDDPAIIMTQTINEGLMRSARGIELEPYRTRFIEMYEEWAEEHDVEPVSGDEIIEQNWGRDNLSFYMHVRGTFYETMYNALRDIGVRIPINTNNWFMYTWELVPQQAGDMMAMNHYYGSMDSLWTEHDVGEGGTPFGRPGSVAVEGRPTIVTEYGHNPPKIYRSAFYPAMAAVASFQGWDSLTGYAYSQRETPREDFASAGHDGAYEWEVDPATIAAFAAGALIYRRGDVRPAEETNLLYVPESEFYRLRWRDGGARQLRNLSWLNASIESHRLRVVLGGDRPEDADVNEVYDTGEAFEYEHPSTQLEADTGEFWRDWDEGVGGIDTPRTQAFYGRVGEAGLLEAEGGLRATLDTPFATVVLSSLTESPIEQTDNLLLVAVARAEPTGAVYSDDGSRLEQSGEAPMLAEPVVGQIRFPTAEVALEAEPIRADGSRGEPIPVSIENGQGTLDLTPEHETIFYEIKVPEPPADHGASMKMLRSDVYEEVLPAGDIHAAGQEAYLRLKAEEPIDPETLRVLAYGEDGREMSPPARWRPAESGDDRDGWAAFTLPEPARESETFAVTADAHVPGRGERVRRKAPIDVTNAPAAKAAPNRTIREDETVDPLPEMLAGAASPVYRIAPGQVFDEPATVRLPVEDEPGDLDIYYYSESPEHEGWYCGERVNGWLVPDSVEIVEEDGQTYLEFEVNHSGVMQLGRDVSAKLGSLGVSATGRPAHWLALAALLALAAWVAIPRRNSFKR